MFEQYIEDLEFSNNINLLNDIMLNVCDEIDSYYLEKCIINFNENQLLKLRYGGS